MLLLRNSLLMDSTKIFPKSVIVNRMMVERDEIIKNDLLSLVGNKGELMT